MFPLDVFEGLTAVAVWHGRLGPTRIVYVRDADFQSVKHHFEADKYAAGKWRMGGLFRNLHAVPVAEGMWNIHIDYGNPNKHWLIGGMVHGIVGCPAWSLLSLWSLGRIETRPSLAQMKHVLRVRD